VPPTYNPTWLVEFKKFSCVFITRQGCTFCQLASLWRLAPCSPRHIECIAYSHGAAAELLKTRLAENMCLCACVCAHVWHAYTCMSLHCLLYPASSFTVYNLWTFYTKATLKSDSGNGFPFWESARNFYLLQCIQNNLGPLRNVSLRGMQLRHEAEHLSPSSVEVKNAWTCTSMASYVFVLWCIMKHRCSLLALQKSQLFSVFDRWHYLSGGLNATFNSTCMFFHTFCICKRQCLYVYMYFYLLSQRTWIFRKELKTVKSLPLVFTLSPTPCIA
jgi:hypothetical protein